MKVNRVVAVLALLTATGLAGCQSASKALGLGKVSPDEFRVVTKAPLTLPPDYALRPPAPGQPRPTELQPESAARQALMGQRANDARDDGEKLLASKAGADRADPLIRYVVDDDFGALAHKDKGFANWVMFWRKGKPAADPGIATDPAASDPAPIDAAAEAARIASLTGNQPVVISRHTETKLKLPGL